MGAQVLGLEVVLPNGQVLRTRGVPKSSTGPNLTQLFIGGEGVFGLITEATLQVFPVPEAHASWSLRFPTFAQGFAAVAEMAAIGLRPALMELTEDFPTGEWRDPHRAASGVSLYLGSEGFQGWLRPNVTVLWRSADDMAVKTSGKPRRDVLGESPPRRRAFSAGSPAKSPAGHPRHPSRSQLRLHPHRPAQFASPALSGGGDRVCRQQGYWYSMWHLDAP